MKFDGAFGNDQACGNLFVGQTLGDQGEDFLFPRGERLHEGWRLGQSANKFRGDHRLEQRAAAVDNSNGGKQFGPWRAFEEIAFGAGAYGFDNAVVGVKGREDNHADGCVDSSQRL